MNNYENILKTTQKGDMIHILMLHSDENTILKSSLEELANIINTKCEKQPCNYYCHNCGKKDVPISECKINIIKWLKEEIIMEIYIVFYKDKPYKTKEGIRVFTDYQKAKNYKNNAVRHIGRLLCEDKDWYDMGEEKKQKWFDKAKKLLEIRSFIETDMDIDKNILCWMCFNYNISNHYAEDLEICQNCKKYKYYKFK